MAYNDNGRGSGERFKGDWKCSECGAPITELPFQPNPDRIDQLKCFDCHKKSRGFSRNGGSRPMFKGNWQCSKCGAEITELPFQPSPGREGELECRDCYKKR